MKKTKWHTDVVRILFSRYRFGERIEDIAREYSVSQVRLRWVFQRFLREERGK